MPLIPRFCSQCSTELILKTPPGDNRERHVCSNCGHIHYLQPKIAGGTIPEVDGKIVLIKRSIKPRPGYWSFPCGFMECDEDIAAAARRETEEETGLAVEITELLGTYSYAESYWGSSIVVVAYRARVTGGELRPCDEVSEAKMLRPEDIPWDHLAFRSSHSALRDWLRKVRDG